MHLNLRRARLRLIALVVVAATVVATVITFAFRGDGSSSPGVVVEIISTPTSVAGGTSMRLPTETPVTLSAVLPAGASGFVYPITGACLPEDESLMPGAPREYRQGIHDGIDFYDSDNCVFIGLDTEVLAAKAGTVIRVDWAYEVLTAEQLAEFEELVEQGGGDEPAMLDAFRGRQVWIDHGNGVVTRYAHLNGIAEGVTVGGRVERGEAIGYVGESGAPESVTNPGTQVHLPFEIRVGDTDLGQELDPDDVRRLYTEALSP